MKLFGVVLLIVMVTISAISHEKHHGSEKPEETEVAKLKEVNEIYLANIKPIFQNACFDCHSSTSNAPWYAKLPGVKQLIASDIAEARKHMDMSNDFPFVSHATPKEDLESIAKAVKNGSMPPFRYRIMHRSNELEESERKLIQNWIEASLRIIKKSLAN